MILRQPGPGAAGRTSGGRPRASGPGYVAAMSFAARSPRVPEPGAEPASADALRDSLGEGRPLDSAFRGEVERRSGLSFDDVRVHTDDRAARTVAAEHARAVTVGTHILFGAGGYRPDTLAGQALLAHELAHTVQQRSAGVEASDSEADADRWALSLARGEARGRPPARGGGLRLQRCDPFGKRDTAARDAGATSPPAPAPLDELDVPGLQARLAQVGATTPTGIEIQWLLALRQSRWSEAARLLRDHPTVRSPENRLRLLGVLRLGTAPIRVEGDSTFQQWVGTQLLSLLFLPSGFRLVVELLGTGRPVTFRQHRGSAQTQASHPFSGRLQVVRPAFPSLYRVSSTDDPSGPLANLEGAAQHIGRARPPAEQVRSEGVGSEILLDPSAGPQYTIGEVAGRRALVDLPPELIVGHELIHALHNARGESVGARTASDRDFGNHPASEYVTITGARRVTGPSGVEEYALTTDISENLLRRDLGRSDRRVAHAGGGVEILTVAEGTGTDALLDRYRLNGAPVTDPLRAHIRAAIAQVDPSPTGTTRRVPSPELVLNYVRGVARDARLARTLEPPGPGAPNPLTLAR